MDNMEFNKIFAALLVAGIVASFTGFVAHKLVHPHDLTENAYKIDGVVDDAAGGAAKAPAMPEPVLGLLASADAARGEQLAKACAACHSFNKGGANAIGPNLWNVVNADKGHHAGFAYSEGMLAKDGEWSYANLNKFLWKPKAYIDGTKMNFVGLKKPQDRADVIAYLRTLADSQPGLPSAGQIEAEAAELLPPVAVDAAAAPVKDDAATKDVTPAKH